MSDIPTPEMRQRAEWALLQAQIEHLRQQARWEPWKAIAAVVAATALFGALVVALAHWGQPQEIGVHLDQPLTIRLEQVR